MDKTLTRNQVFGALALIELWNGEDGLLVMDDYRPKFSGGNACFAVVFNTNADSYRFMMQLAYQLQAADARLGALKADDLACDAVQDGPVLYFPGWQLVN